MRLRTGITMSFENWGRPGAPVVVLLHPWLESADAFSLMRPTLATKVRAFVPDARGHGASGKPRDGYDLPSLAADVVAFLDALSIDSALLVGASSGGYVAQEVASSHPERITGLVLAGAPRSLHGRTPPFAQEIANLGDPIDVAWVKALVSGFAVAGAVADDFLSARTQDALAVPPDIWRESLAGLTSSPTPDSDRICAPTLVVSGAHDSLLGRAEAQALVSSIRGARWTEYADAGHVIHWEQPARLATDILQFAAGTKSSPHLA